MFGLGLLLTGSALTSCEDQPDKYEMTDGVPTIHYIRMADVAVKDSLITGAYMQNTICIVGDNLRSIYKLLPLLDEVSSPPTPANFEIPKIAAATIIKTPTYLTQGLTITFAMFFKF